MSSKISLDGTVIALAAMEVLEDRLLDVVSHFQIPDVKKTAATISLKITINPDEQGNGFEYSLSSNTTLPPKKAFKGRMYAECDKNGISVTEFNPQQMRMFDGKEAGS